MKALLILLLASLVYVPEVQAQSTQSNDTPIVKEYNETRLQRGNRDRRHWRDRVNDREGNYRERNSDGWFRIEIRPYVHPSRPTAEVNCNYVERIDSHGQRSFDFICP